MSSNSLHHHGAVGGGGGNSNAGSATGGNLNTVCDILHFIKIIFRLSPSSIVDREANLKFDH